MSAGQQREDSVGLTTEQMTEAYQLARKADWPPLHEIVLQVTRFKLITGLALRRARGERTGTASTSAEPPRRSVSPPLPQLPPQLDCKSLAAGERPERD